MLGNIVEVADISITIPSNGADNETGRLGCPGLVRGFAAGLSIINGIAK